MIQLLLHDDWEIYGDGTGDPVSLMFEPAKRILDICDKYGAKYTFYAEVGQQLHMLDAPHQKWKKYANSWEEIIKDAVQRGHDVQLHFHPQWIGAELENGKWKLDFKKWSAGQVEEELLIDWIGKGKQYLENLLKPVKENYKVLSYRAGGWLCQPSSGLYKAFRKHGIVCDVSVMKGRYAEFDDGSRLDFRDAVSRYEPWEVAPDNFAREQVGSGVWELPVFTEESELPHPVYLLKKTFSPLYYYGINKKRKVRKGGGDYSPNVRCRGKSKEYYGSFGYMHHNHLMSYVKHIQNLGQTGENSRHLIFLTHSKSFLNFENFSFFLEKVNKNQQIRFATTQYFIESQIINKQ